MADLAELQRILGHEFSRPALLERAFTHRSYANERGAGTQNSERLEFLGDAVLGLVIGAALMERFPEVDEGELSTTRAAIVRESGLAAAAKALALGAYLRLGKGEENTGGRTKPSLLADAFEAMIGALYVDAGFERAKATALELLGPALESAAAGSSHDHKTRLQELAQARTKEAPEYEVVSSSGPDHDKRFLVRVLIGGDEKARAEGKSKKSAEQAAAALALEVLDGAPDGVPDDG